MSHFSSHETKYPIPTFSHKDTGSLARRISFSLATFAMGLASAIIAFLALISLFNTGYFLPPGSYEVTITSERMLLKQGLPTPLFMASCLVLIIILLYVSFLLIKIIPDCKIGTFVFLYSLCTTLLWVLSLNPIGGNYSYPDSISLIDSASSIVEGRFSDFAPGAAGHPSLHAYFSWYPFQAGALFWFVLIFSIFGINNLIAFLVVNAIATSLSVWSIWKLGCSSGLSSLGKRILSLLLVINIPLITSTGFIYTNTVGFCCALLSVLASVTAMRSNSKYEALLWMIISFIVGGIAMTIKGTEILFVLSITAIFTISSIRKHRYVFIPIILLLFLFAKWSSNLPILLLQHLTGQEFGKGLPQLSWIAIGLTQQSQQTTMPGWWNTSAIQIFNITQGDTALQQTFARTTIWSSISGFLSDPQYAWNFFSQKIASEWAEPTHQSLYYSSFIQRGKDSSLWTMFTTEPNGHRLIAFQNVYQFIVYALASLGIATAVKQKQNNAQEFEVMCLISIMIMAGFFCFLLWEAKSVYVLPFAALMTIPASHGLQHIGGGASLAYRKIRRKSETKPGE